MKDFIDRTPATPTLANANHSPVLADPSEAEGAGFDLTTGGESTDVSGPTPPSGHKTVTQNRIDHRPTAKPVVERNRSFHSPLQAFRPEPSGKEISPLQDQAPFQFFREPGREPSGLASDGLSPFLFPSEKGPQLPAYTPFQLKIRRPVSGKSVIQRQLRTSAGQFDKGREEWKDKAKGEKIGAKLREYEAILEKGDPIAQVDALEAVYKEAREYSSELADLPEMEFDGKAASQLNGLKREIKREWSFLFLKALAAEGDNIDARIEEWKERYSKNPEIQKALEASSNANRPSVENLKNPPKEGIRYTTAPGKAFIGEPDPGHVTQGFIGDCWLLSTLMAAASIPEGRQKLKEMIDPHDEANVYTVRFWEKNEEGQFGRGEGINVSVQFPVLNSMGKPRFAFALAGFHLPNEENQIPLWPAVIEKAYAIKKGGYRGIDTGRGGRTALEAIMGKAAISFATGEDNKRLKKWIFGKLKGGFPVIAAMRRHYIWVKSANEKEVTVVDQGEEETRVTTHKWKNFFQFFQKVESLATPEEVTHEESRKQQFSDYRGKIDENSAKEISPALPEMESEKGQSDLFKSGSLKKRTSFANREEEDPFADESDLVKPRTWEKGTVVSVEEEDPFASEEDPFADESDLVKPKTRERGTVVSVEEEDPFASEEDPFADESDLVKPRTRERGTVASVGKEEEDPFEILDIDWSDEDSNEGK